MEKKNAVVEIEPSDAENDHMMEKEEEEDAAMNGDDQKQTSRTRRKKHEYDYDEDAIYRKRRREEIGLMAVIVFLIIIAGIVWKVEDENVISPHPNASGSSSFVSSTTGKILYKSKRTPEGYDNEPNWKPLSPSDPNYKTRFHIEHPLPHCMATKKVAGLKPLLVEEFEKARHSDAYLERLKFHNATNYLKTFTFFLGYPHTGHTLVGAILDAHPNVLIANEANIFSFLEYRKFDLPRKDLFQYIAKWAEFKNRHNWQMQGYSYYIPETFQGRWKDKLLSIGDKKGGSTSHFFSQCLSPLGEKSATQALHFVRQLVEVPLRIIHVVRNPYDFLVVDLARKRGTYYRHSFEEKQDVPEPCRTRGYGYLSYDRLKSLESKFISRYAKHSLIRKILLANPNNLGQMYDLRIEDLTANPGESIKNLCKFIGIVCNDEVWLTRVSHKVRASPHKHWKDFCWSQKWVKEFEVKLRADPFLIPYAGTIPQAYQHDDEDMVGSGEDEDEDENDDEENDASEEFSFKTTPGIDDDDDEEEEEEKEGENDDDNSHRRRN